MGRMTSHILWKIKNVPNHQPVIKVGVGIGQMNILIQDEDTKTMGMTRMARMMRMSMKRRRMMIMIMIMIALLHLAATLRHGIRMHHRSIGARCGSATPGRRLRAATHSCGEQKWRRHVMWHLWRLHPGNEHSHANPWVARWSTHGEISWNFDIYVSLREGMYKWMAWKKPSRRRSCGSAMSDWYQINSGVFTNDSENRKLQMSMASKHW